jgi:hypothetical protein
MPSMSRAASHAEAQERAAKEEALRKRAARQAAANLKGEAPPDPIVECLVLPMGDGKISMGEHIGGLGTAHYDEGETFSVGLPIAVALYDRGYVNFEGAKQASADARAERARLAAEAREAARQAADEAANA